MVLLRFVARMLSVGIMVGGAGAVFAQNYPSKPIRIITGGVGGGNDFVARLIAQGITGSLGQPLIVENRTPALYGELVSKGLPDGYTLGLGSSTLWVSTLLQKQPYDPLKDFAWITMTSRAPNLFVVHPSLPAASVKEFIALAKAKPGALNYGTTGLGTSLHLGAELLKSMAGINLVHVPYKSTGQAISELIGNQVQLMFSSIPGVLPHVKAGRLRALAVTSAEPTALAPGLPTMAASGLPGYEIVSVEGFFAPAKTPGPIIARVHDEVVRFINQPEPKEKFFNVGSEVVGNTPEQFATAIKAELARVSKLIKDAGIRAD